MHSKIMEGGIRMNKTIRETLKQIGVTGIGEKDITNWIVTELREIKNEYNGTEITIYKAETKETASKELSEAMGMHIPVKTQYFMVENRTACGSDSVDYLKVWFDVEPGERKITQVLVLHSLIDFY